MDEYRRRRVSEDTKTLAAELLGIVKFLLYWQNSTVVIECITAAENDMISVNVVRCDDAQTFPFVEGIRMEEMEEVMLHMSDMATLDGIHVSSSEIEGYKMYTIK